VLSPMHRGVIGAQNLNREIQQVLNPAGAHLERGGVTFRVGDKVMQMSNNYDRDVFNGDIGFIATIDREDHVVKVNFDGRIVTYEFNDMDELELAYCISIHKSQGSEYKAVIIPIHTAHYVMLQRNLLYTGVTRGKKLVCLVGQRRAVSMAINNVSSEPRFSALDQRLRKLRSALPSPQGL
jgi:exodeoxyribonuclease V alpha subunit